MKRIAGFLFFVVLLIGGLLVASRLIGRGSDHTLSVLFGTAVGLAEGQVVEIAGVGPAGRIRALEPLSDGVLVTIELDGAPSLGERTLVVLRPGTPPVPSRLEIIPSEGSTSSLTYPARLKGRIEIGPPDGLAEPSPVWPGGEI